MSCDEELDLDQLARDSLHFRRRELELAPGEKVRTDARAWRDAIVFLESGEVELECAAGERSRFAVGAVLCFPPPVRFLRNSGDEPARLITISRRTRERPKRNG
jgi:mannose-6-phosphate isomerase-like protein (cupin superfamily)